MKIYITEIFKLRGKVVGEYIYKYFCDMNGIGVFMSFNDKGEVIDSSFNPDCNPYEQLEAFIRKVRGNLLFTDI